MSARYWPRLVYALLACSSIAQASGADEVEVLILNEDNWESAVPAGKEVDAIAGDAVLRNRYVTAVIAQPIAGRHANMTIRDVGGCLIDYTSRIHPNDQLGAYFPGAGRFQFHSWSFHDALDRAVNAVASPRYSSAMEIRVQSIVAPGRPDVVITYRLEADAPYLLVTQQFHNLTRSPSRLHYRTTCDSMEERRIYLKLPMAPTSSSGEMIVSGDRPTGGKPTSTRSRLVAIRIEARCCTAGNPEEAFALLPGETTRLSLRILVADNLCEIHSLLAEQQSAPRGQAALTFSAATQFLPGARIEFTRQGHYFGTLWTDGSGRIDQKLPLGEYQIEVSHLGQTVMEQTPLTMNSGLNIQDFEAAHAVGVLKVNIVDERQQAVPCKLQLIRADVFPALNFGPSTAVAGVKNVRYLSNGQDEILLPAGDYEAILSRGPEYNAVFKKFSITDSAVTRLSAELPRVVQTAGWVSAEFHSHASPSGDTTNSPLGRVLNLLCEQIEFAPCTEHNRIDTYQPQIDALGIQTFLATCAGMELTGTPLPLNHQNAFPLEHHPHAQDGGGPLTDASPEVQIRRLKEWDQLSEKLIQQNHPDIGWLFFDKSGDGIPDGGFAEALPFIDAMEIHPITSILKYDSLSTSPEPVKQNRMFNWLQLLNQGYRITGVVNTDAHDNFHGSGLYRNWVRCSTDLPAEIKPREIVTSVKHGAVIMSNGPYLTVEVTELPTAGQSYGPGDLMPLRGDSVQVTLTVQCPNWFDIDRVYLLLNGRTLPEHDFRVGTHANMFHKGPLKFSSTIPLRLAKDTHLIVVAAGERSQLGPVMGPHAGNQPVAVSNPVFIDVAGDGFQPNFDVLDGALPVKGE
ncbi:MAG: CehA/McbA family metallohydrolase [Planctomycetaceae bacterium]